MPPRYQVFVCRHVTCTSLFADDVFRELRRQIQRAGLSDLVVLDRGGCYSRCGGGVTVVVRSGIATAPGPDDVVYPEVMEPEVRRIVEEHLRDRRPVAAMQVACRGAKPPPAGV